MKRVTAVDGVLDRISIRQLIVARNGSVDDLGTSVPPTVVNLDGTIPKSPGKTHAEWLKLQVPEPLRTRLSLLPNRNHLFLQTGKRLGPPDAHRYTNTERIFELDAGTLQFKLYREVYFVDHSNIVPTYAVLSARLLTTCLVTISGGSSFRCFDVDRNVVLAEVDLNSDIRGERVHEFSIFYCCDESRTIILLGTSRYGDAKVFLSFDYPPEMKTMYVTVVDNSLRFKISRSGDHCFILREGYVCIYKWKILMDSVISLDDDKIQVLNALPTPMEQVALGGKAFELVNNRSKLFILKDNNHLDVYRVGFVFQNTRNCQCVLSYNGRWLCHYVDVISGMPERLLLVSDMLGAYELVQFEFGESAACVELIKIDTTFPFFCRVMNSDDMLDIDPPNSNMCFKAIACNVHLELVAILLAEIDGLQVKLYDMRTFELVKALKPVTACCADDGQAETFEFNSELILIVYVYNKGKDVFICPLLADTCDVM